MTFAANSRYQTTPSATMRDATGEEVAYLQRRFVPQSSTFSLLRLHTVVASERSRLDNIAARELGDPELFWRLCDANGALDPDELTLHPGRRLRITLPAGIPGMTDA